MVNSFLKKNHSPENLFLKLFSIKLALYIYVGKNHLQRLLKKDFYIDYKYSILYAVINLNTTL